jgi:hypothetical protein
MEPSPKDFLKLHWIVFLFGFTAILGKEMTIPATDVVMYRTAIASIVLAAYMYYKSKSLKVDM